MRVSTSNNHFLTPSLTSYSLPTFFIEIFLIFIFADALNLFPPVGTIPGSWAAGLPPWYDQIIPRLKYLFLPTLTLTLFTYGGFLLLTRATMMETLSEDYITTARAKCLSERVILLLHALKYASLPLFTTSALSLGGLFGGP